MSALLIPVFLGGGLIVAARVAASAEQVRKSKADAVRVLNQSATMYESRNYFVTRVTGPVGKEGIPAVIRLGDVVTVKGTSIRVNHIFVTQYLVEMKWGKEVLARAGDVKCMIVESEKDLPDDEEINRRWIKVEQCQSIAGPESPPTASTIGVLLMTPSKWEDLSKDQQSLYVKGFLETISFVLYGDFPRNAESVKTFSDWTACAEREKLGAWMPFGWILKGEVSRTAASQFYDIIPTVCKKMGGKGDKTWSPVRLISKGQWSSLSLQDKEIYVTAYVETTDDLFRRTKQTTNVQRLENCIRKDGIGKIMNVVENMPIERQSPLPWSVAVALGKPVRKSRRNALPHLQVGARELQ
jgi:hypothetical protein